MRAILTAIQEPWSAELIGAFLFISGIALGVLVASPY
jgi:hypothetical protein